MALEPGLAQPGTANANPDGADPPPTIDISPGSNGGNGGSPFDDCDGVGDCSDTLEGSWGPGAAHDLVWLGFEALVPQQAHGYTVRVALLTAEYPERLDAFSDTLVWWSSSEAYTGNLATVDLAPATVATLAHRMAYTGGHAALLRTGMDGIASEACTAGTQMLDPCPIGGATPWLELSGPVVPGEIASVTVALFDRGDDQGDTTVLLDGWRWRCEGCTAGVDCGLHP